MTESASQAHPLDPLVDRPLPGGGWAFGPHESWLLHDAVGSTPEQAAHPIMAFLAAQRGLGLTVAELFALFGTDMADGPLLTESTLELHTDLHPDVSYEVRGTVVSAVRKSGRTLGVFDLVTARFDVLEPDATVPAATVTNVYALPRAGDQP
ncbi:MAG TPA: hypothetical protein VL595_04100 [Pseudonocardia sp.]|nr:hypothetical protein [Pseudonocardia sp.]